MKTKKQIEREKLKSAVEEYLKNGGRITKLEIMPDQPIYCFNTWGETEQTSWTIGPSFKSFRPGAYFE